MYYIFCLFVCLQYILFNARDSIYPVEPWILLYNINILELCSGCDQVIGNILFKTGFENF